jgi:hypothetical protein
VVEGDDGFHAVFDAGVDYIVVVCEAGFVDGTAAEGEDSGP